MKKGLQRYFAKPADDETHLEWYSVGKKFCLAAKEFCLAEEECCRLAEEFYSVEKESCRVQLLFG